MDHFNKKISIDSALNQLLTSQVESKSVSYSDFLEKLDEHNKKNILIDKVLEEKLEFQETKTLLSWKKIIMIIWFRRIRNASIVLLLLGTMSLIMNSLIDKNTNKQNQIKIENSNSKIHIEENNLIAKKFNHQENNISESKSKKLITKYNHINNSNFTNGNFNYKLENAFVAEKDKDVNNNFLDFNLKLYELKKIKNIVPIVLESINQIALLPINLPKNKKRSIHGNLSKTGFEVGINVMYSFQNYTSNLNSNETDKINRNYKDLANDGKKESKVTNYGISIEKTIYKGFGLSFGINKFTLQQQQQTNFTLTEAPVYDIDGSIAGYINIMPENIISTISNNIHYISAPINLMYGVNLGTNNNLKFNIGSSVLGLVNDRTSKFDYKNLELIDFNQSSKKLSLNNIQFGICYNRNLVNNFILSLGYEKQIINKINPLSDYSEKVSSNINNFIISLKYKL